MHWKKILRKLIKKVSILSIISFIVLGLLFPLKLNAISYNVQERFLGQWTAVAGGSEGLYGNGTFITVDGQPSWCLQANKGAATGPNSPITPEEIGVSQSQIKRLSLIAWYGYRNQANDDNYILTQNLIWQELGYQSYYKSTTYPNKASMQSWFNNVLNLVNNFAYTPSFHGNTYEVNVNETLTIEDTNGVLNDLSVDSVAGANITKSGNILSITPDITSADTITITFNRGISVEQTKTNFVVRSGNSQAVSCLTGSDPYRASIRVKVNKFGSLQLTKQDNKGNYVPNTGFKLAYNEDMTDAIGTYTTLSNGKILVNDLLPTNK